MGSAENHESPRWGKYCNFWAQSAQHQKVGANTTHRDHQLQVMHCWSDRGSDRSGFKETETQLVSPATAHSSHGILGGKGCHINHGGAWGSTAVFHKVHRAGGGVIWKDHCMLRRPGPVGSDPEQAVIDTTHGKILAGTLPGWMVPIEMPDPGSGSWPLNLPSRLRLPCTQWEW